MECRMTLVVAIAWLFLPSLYGQQLISPFGGYIENNQSSLSFTIGEPIVHTLLTDDASVTQGFQQPNMVVIENLSLEYTNGLIVDAPNDNGTFIINGIEEYPENQIIILNRWGDVVYKAQPYQNEWRGYRNNRPLPQATYYFIFYPDVASKQVVKGNIYLLK